MVGAPAQNNLVNDPGNTVIEVKREMGRLRQGARRARMRPARPSASAFRNRDYLPQEISAFILMELKRQAENFVGEPIHDAVITVPAYFKEPQRGATEDAARMARLNVRRLLNEPTAAAVCFGADKIEDGRTHTYAVYDLGGGTFDVSIIQISKGNVSVVGTGGDPRLGGGDFDDKITELRVRTDPEAARRRPQRRPAVWQRDQAGGRDAQARARRCDQAATLNLPFLTPTLSANIPLSRATFEHLIKGLLDRSLRCLDEAIESAYESNGVERDEIEQVLLVGGSTRIACGSARCSPSTSGSSCGTSGPTSVPDEVVARGAGMVARDYAASDGYEGRDIAIAGVGGRKPRSPAAPASSCRTSPATPWASWPTTRTSSRSCRRTAGSPARRPEGTSSTAPGQASSPS